MDENKKLELMERNISKAQRGGMALTVIQHINSILESEKAMCITQLISKFDGGKLDFMSSVAKLAALEGLKQTLKRQVIQGGNARKDIDYGRE